MSGIEIHIGYGGEEPFNDEAVDGGILCPKLPRFCRIQGNPFQAVKKQILESRDFRFLAAYPGY
jgi:hypothetical protein